MATDTPKEIDKIDPEDFRDLDMEEESNSSFLTCSTDDEENDAHHDGDWRETGELQIFSFTNIHNFNVGQRKTPMDYFDLLFNNTFMTILVSSVNAQANQSRLEDGHGSSKHPTWNDTSVEEMRTFIGLLLHMGTIQISRLYDYWNSDSLFGLPYPQFMSCDRFFLLLQNLCFFDSEHRNNSDPNQYVKSIVSFFNNQMKTIETPTRELVIDENYLYCLTFLGMKHRIKGKRHNDGVKVYVVTDVCGITQRIHVHFGSNSRDHTDKVVMILMEDYLNFGHSLYMDKVFNSVTLAEKLLDHKTYVTGTLKPKRSRNPQIVINSRISQGSCVSRYNSRGVIVSKYKDKKNKYMISTEHSADFVEQTRRNGKTVQKPRVYVEWCRNKAVTKEENMMLSHPIYTKSIQWHKKIIVQIMQIMMLNAFKIYKEHNKMTNTKERESKKFSEFQIRIIEQLLQVDNKHNIITTSTGEQIHYLDELPLDESGNQIEKSCQYCLEVEDKRKTTPFFCSFCPDKPGLCIECFRYYHNY